jgi:hypothetical protein
MKARLHKTVFQMMVVVCVSVLVGCGERQPASRAWADIYSEFQSQGEVVLDTQPTGMCRVGIGVAGGQIVATGQMMGVEGTFGSPKGPVRFKFEARDGKYVVAYPVTMEDGTVVAVAVYTPVSNK